MSGLRAIDELADRLEDLDLTCMEGCVGPNLCDGTCVRSALAESRLARYPHDDDLCRQDSVDAACFKDLCRALASTDVPEGMGASEAVHWLSARESAARAEVLAKVEALHAPYRIYDECGHEHTDEDYEAGRCVEAAEIGYVCDEGLLYVICRECCCDYDGFNYWQTETCANGHDDHTTVVGPSLCPTRALIADLGRTND